MTPLGPIEKYIADILLIAKFTADTNEGMGKRKLLDLTANNWVYYMDSEMDLENWLFAKGLNIDQMKMADGVESLYEAFDEDQDI